MIQQLTWPQFLCLIADGKERKLDKSRITYQQYKDYLKWQKEKIIAKRKK